MIGERALKITDWAEETFGPAPSVARIAARANEEMAELLRKATMPEGTHSAEEIAEEAADITIVLYRVCRVLGKDLDAEVDRKHGINEGRNWQLDGTGHGYHVRQR